MQKMNLKNDSYFNSYNNTLSLESMVKILQKDGFEVKVNNKQEITPTHLRHFSEIDKNCLSFYTEKDSKFLNSKDRYVLICNSEIDEISPLVTYIFTNKPKAAFYRIAQFYKQRSNVPGVHPSSVISPDSIVDKAAYIGPFCYLENCEIKAGVVLTSNISIFSNTTIGFGTIVNPNTTIGVDGVLYAFGPNQKKIYMPSFRNTYIGDACIIGANVTIAKGSLDDTIVGSSCNIGHGSKIGHDCKIGEQTHLANGVAMAGSSKIGKRCFIGSGSCFKPDVKISDDIVVGIGSVVVKNCDISESVLFGNPAKILKWINIYSKLKGMPQREEK